MFDTTFLYCHLPQQHSSKDFHNLIKGYNFHLITFIFMCILLPSELREMSKFIEGTKISVPEGID